MIHRMLGNCAVIDLERAEQWYTRVFGGPPDSRPMTGLIEWHLSATFGLQIWSDPARAGYSSVILGETDLDTAAERLIEVGIQHAGPESGGGERLLQLRDPDGNQLVLFGH